MISKLPQPKQAIDYEKEAQAYCRSLPLEHFMESTAQATQRQITVNSLHRLAARRSDVQVFSELLIQYESPDQRKLGQVVPDNMVVLCEAPVLARSSFNLPLEQARPFWVLEYVSPSNKRKDYEESYRKYERELKVPYYLVFHPDEQDLTLNHLKRGRYVKVKPNGQGRYAIEELDLELGLLDGWVRYWHKGELLPLPDELQQIADAALGQAAESKWRAEESDRRAEESSRRAEELQRRLDAAEQELAKLRPRQSNP